MNHHLASSALLLVAATLAASGCGPKPTPHSLGQIDVGGYVIKDGKGVMVAAIWVDGTTGAELWAKGALTATSPQPWTVSQTQDATCLKWLTNSACALPSPTLYSASFTKQTWSCNPPIPDPEPSTPAFLPPGSYQVQGGSSAWIYVDKNVEYWAMDGLIGKAGAGIVSDGFYNSPTTLVSYVCKTDPKATMWFTPSYKVQDAGFCKTPPAGCTG